LNRIDDIIVFQSLSLEQIEKIVRLTLDALRVRLAEREISLTADDAAIRLIAEEAYDPAYGARPVKRYVQKNIENEIAKMVISGSVMQGNTVHIGTADQKLTFQVE
jgi:ATP-dependent Clp protease ATP-binding subunit ClpB